MDASPYSIRRATAEDLVAIVQLDAESNPHPWGKGLIEDALASRENWLIYHQESHHVCGWLTASVVFDQSELELIVVDQKMRRQGLAQRLLSAWIEAAKAKKVSEYLLEVRESNLGAIALYEKMGFECVGKRKNYYPTEQGREAACLFTLTLGKALSAKHEKGNQS